MMLWGEPWWKQNGRNIRSTIHEAALADPWKKGIVSWEESLTMQARFDLAECVQRKHLVLVNAKYSQLGSKKANCRPVPPSLGFLVCDSARSLFDTCSFGPRSSCRGNKT